MLESYLRLLACVARADGVIAKEETSILEAAVHKAAITPKLAEELGLIMDPGRPVDTDSIIDAAVAEMRGAAWSASGAALLAETVRDCYVMAAIDGEVSPSEVSVIARMLHVAGVPEQRRATLHHWAESAARASLDGAALFMETLVAPGLA